MDYDIWTGQYKRLCALYGRAVKGAQAAEYFKAVQGYSGLVMDEAITTVGKTHKTWPNAAVLCEVASGVIRGISAPPRVCDLCHGNGFIDAPDEEHHGRTYSNYVRRCPQCRPAAVKGDAA